MKNNLKHKSLLERGGLMIEALAMLGLIAVVTPTMYKKSAERTMEVDDINTATTIRSYVSAAESYMTTNYVSIMKDFKDEVPEGETQPAEQYKSITNNDLADFLPYKFKSASSLYDYNEPKVTVVKNGNNLTAFLLFPAKGAGDDGLGQERTARIASLVGANGGYVRSEHNARGIGGIWSLNGSTYTNVFPSDNSPIYSIVASTPNAINGNTQIDEFENPKYLQRTFECSEDATEAEKERCKAEETWRNTMRTDVYLGGYNDMDELPEDNPSSEKMHNIRNIGSLIVGAEEQADIDGATSYGLYIAENVNNNATIDDGSSNQVPNPNAKSNAYIGGSLMAGLRNFFVDKDSLNYGPRTEYNPATEKYEQVGYKFNINSQTGDVTQYGGLNLAIADSYCMNPEVRIGSYLNESYGIYDRAIDGDFRRLTLSGTGNDNMDNGMISLTYDAYSDYNYDAYSTISKIHGGAINIGNAYPGKTGQVSVSDAMSQISTETIDNIAYKAPQNFPVTIGENTYVQGLLAADQLDTQKLRTASLSTGSEHVDDEYKWLNVDKDGVVIASTTRTGEAYSIMDTEVHIDDSGVSMRHGGTSDCPGAKLQLYADTYSDASGVYSEYSIAGEAKDITFTTEDTGTLALQNSSIGQTMTGNRIDIGLLDNISGFNNSTYDRRYGYYSEPYTVTFRPDGYVNLVGTNLRTGYRSGDRMVNVLSVNNNAQGDSDILPDESLKGSGYPENFDVAMHGNVLFTDGQSGAHKQKYPSDNKHMIAQMQPALKLCQLRTLPMPKRQLYLMLLTVIYQLTVFLPIMMAIIQNLSVVWMLLWIKVLCISARARLMFCR
ncbi:MAG: hypothetical protein MJ212_05120 [Alphaproteobacteria bacterium]|nr:hypothetical protein [Alphaproteobacteria bacterium]